MTNSFDFFSPNDTRWKRAGGGRPQRPEWELCPPGSCWFSAATQAEVKAGKKRPGIPARFQGEYTTSGGEFQGQWGYQVYRKPASSHLTQTLTASA